MPSYVVGCTLRLDGRRWIDDVSHVTQADSKSLNANGRGYPAIAPLWDIGQNRPIREVSLADAIPLDLGSQRQLSGQWDTALSGA
jgi:hypothetical protein